MINAKDARILSMRRFDKTSKLFDSVSDKIEESILKGELSCEFIYETHDECSKLLRFLVDHDYDVAIIKSSTLRISWQ